MRWREQTRSSEAAKSSTCQFTSGADSGMKKQGSDNAEWTGASRVISANATMRSWSSRLRSLAGPSAIVEPGQTGYRVPFIWPCGVAIWLCQSPRQSDDTHGERTTSYDPTMPFPLTELAFWKGIRKSSVWATSLNRGVSRGRTGQGLFFWLTL